MADSGFVVVARRPVMSDGRDVWRYPDSYRLVIPGGPTWDMPAVEPEDFRPFICAPLS